MHHAIKDDRLWFQKHPSTIIHFRKLAQGEFAPLLQHGEETPSFRPSFSKRNAPLSWVAVVNLMSLLGASAESETHSARLRIRIPAIRSKRHRITAKNELISAITSELLSQNYQERWNDNTKDKNNELSNGPNSVVQIAA